MITASMRRDSLRRVVPALALLAGTAGGGHAAPLLPTGFQDQVLVSQLDRPVDLAFLPDGRTIVIELKSAKIRLIVGGSLASTDPIGVLDSVKTVGPEEGLLGVAVDPRWPGKPFLYLFSTALDSTLRISRLTLSGDLFTGTSWNLSIVPGSRRELIRDVVSRNTNHNGGTLRFGPDSLLYASFGEDAVLCNATDSTGLYGVIARMDVRRLPDSPGPPDKSLLVAAGNPYADRPDPDTRLIYARGFRNPFRFSIDPPTGRLFIGDVGQDTYEEIDLIQTPALYYGWPFLEGTATYATSQCGVPPAGPYQAPIFEYGRAQYCPYPNPADCQAAVIGGVVVRPVPGSPVSFPPEYAGQYVFSEFFGGFLWRLRDSSGTWVSAQPVAGQPSARDWATGYEKVSSMVPGADGALYYTRLDYGGNPSSGSVGRIIHPNGALAVPDGLSADELLSRVYPTPARGSATVGYVLARPARVQLVLYDALGRRVRGLVMEVDQAAGEHRVHWDGTDDWGRPASPGVYVARLTADGEPHELRVPLVR